MRAPLAAAARALDRAAAWVAATALFAMLAASALEILARNLFHAGVPGSELLARHLVLWVALTGAALAVQDERHLRIDLTHWLPAAWRQRLAHLFAALAVGICAALAWAAARFWWVEWSEAQAVTRWAAALLVILPLGFLLLALRFAIHMIARFART
jgi:TRAP-type C4-dicarboxylate transport system permease small subunit